MEREKATPAMGTCFNKITCFMRAIHLLSPCITFQQKHSCFGQSKEPVRHCKFASPAKLAALSSVMATTFSLLPNEIRHFILSSKIL